MKAKGIFEKCAQFKEAKQLQSLGVYPYFRTIETAEGNQVACAGGPKIMIGSNNYLGLAQDPRVIEASYEALRKYGAGCSGSRFLNGNTKLHEELEEELADFLKKEAVLIFSTGFSANQGALEALLEEGDAIICDRENHASILDGCSNSKAKTIRFAHNSPEALRRELAQLNDSQGKLLILDGVFSMSGDIVDLPGMVNVAKEYSCPIYVDEAHALGVLGPNGEGTVHHFGQTKAVDLIMGTFSKSLGSMGGFVSGPKYVIDYLKHKARAFMFTASLAPSVVGGVLKALRILRTEPHLMANLWKNTHKMHDGLRSLGFNIGTTTSPIVPIFIGSEMKAFTFGQKLFEAGIFAIPVVYPAVRYGGAIIRTSYMATHTDQELDYVLETLFRLGKDQGLFESSGNAGKIKSKGYDFSSYQQENA